MRKTVLMVFSLWALLVVLAGCASVTKDIKVDTEVDPKANLSGYKTYAWLGSAQVVVDTIGKWEPPGFDADAELKWLIDRELRARNIHPVDRDPDMLVAFAAGVDMDALELKVDPDTKQQMLDNVPKGALAVVLIDAATGKPLWVGVATGDIQETPTDEIVRKRLDYAVKEMFERLPLGKEASGGSDSDY